MEVLIADELKQATFLEGLIEEHAKRTHTNFVVRYAPANDVSLAVREGQASTSILPKDALGTSPIPPKPLFSLQGRLIVGTSLDPDGSSLVGFLMSADNQRFYETAGSGVTPAKTGM